jgi:site-specific recombinase XerD
MKVLHSKVTAEQCAEVVREQRDHYYRSEPQIKGLAYSRIREAVRGFFMSVRNMSGMHMTNLGVGKEALMGNGKFSRQRVPREVRHRLEEILIQRMADKRDVKYLEVLGICKFNFSTGTRISASLAFNFSKHQYELTPAKWMFEILDKGSRGKKKRWEKILMGDLLDHFKEYCSKRFDIPFDELEAELPLVTDHLFPSFIDERGRVRDDRVRRIVKPLLIEAGLRYKEFPPTHIWRHTFAQEGLKATGYKYELVASLGGWVNTSILKKHYGEMGEAARERGLMKAMGMEIPEVIEELAW